MYNGEIDRNVDGSKGRVWDHCSYDFDANYPMEPPAEDIRGDFEKF